MAKIRKRYNQVPHLTQDTTWESNKNTINITNKSQIYYMSAFWNKLKVYIFIASGYIYPYAFFKRRRGYFNRLRPSVCPFFYLFLNHWTKFNQIWGVSYSHKWGVQRQFILPRPLGPWGGVKRSSIIYFQLQSQFQRFFSQTLCVFSQMKDTKHIRRDFYSVAWVIPQGWDLGALHRGSFFSNMVMWHIESPGITSKTECK